MNNSRFSRRQFMAHSAAGAVVAISGRLLDASAAPSQGIGEAADQLVAGKDPGLVVHAASPLQLETPVKLLRSEQITPKNLLFVRNNQVLEGANTLAPWPKEDWKVELTGLVAQPASISLAELCRLPQVDEVVVLQCSGNGRALFSKTAPAEGAQWQLGGMGNVRFGGPRLVDVLKAAKVDVQPKARFVTAEGADKPAKPSDDFEHSLPLDDVLARSIVALRLNDEPLPALHGGPVRLVTPGYYGTMNVKWLTRLRFEDAETHNHHQAERYRTPNEPVKPGSKFKYELNNSEPNWRMRLKSVIFSPEEGQQLAAGESEVTGVAFNDGLTPIEGVYVSTDGGAAWQRAEMEKPAGPFAWHGWKTRVRLGRGPHKIVARAVDAQGRTQPLDGAVSWNPAGYAYSGVHVVSVDVAG